MVLTVSVFAGEGGGGWSGGGGNKPYDEQNPWFLGTRPIEYCIERSGTFSQNSDQVRQAISESFLEWKKVLLNYGLENPLPGTFKGGEHKGLTVDAIELPQCFDPAHQIVFKIGKIDSFVRQYFNTHSNYSYGFAFRPRFDHETHRSGGIVWIAPENWLADSGLPMCEGGQFCPRWSVKGLFKSIILHELGHVFGFPHMSGTIMRENIFEYIQAASNFDPEANLAQMGFLLTGKVEHKSLALNPFKSSAKIVGNGEKPLCNILDQRNLLPRNEMDSCREEYEFSESMDPSDMYEKYVTIRITSKTYSLEQKVRLSWDSFNLPSIVFRSNSFVTDKLEDLLLLFDSKSSLKGIIKLEGHSYPFQMFFGAPMNLTILRTDSQDWFWEGSYITKGY